MRELHLPPSIVTPTDVTALELEIRSYSTWFSHEQIKASVKAKNGSTAPQLSPVAIEVVKTWCAGEQLSSQHLEVLLEALASFKKSAPVITITLAANADGETKRTLVAWCRDNIAGNMLISFRINQTLLGGMVVRCGSHVFDWSFRRSLLDSQLQFSEVLRRV